MSGLVYNWGCFVISGIYNKNHVIKIILKDFGVIDPLSRRNTYITIEYSFRSLRTSYVHPWASKGVFGTSLGNHEGKDTGLSVFSLVFYSSHFADLLFDHG